MNGSIPKNKKVFSISCKNFSENLKNYILGKSAHVISSRALIGKINKLRCSKTFNSSIEFSLKHWRNLSSVEKKDKTFQDPIFLGNSTKEKWYIIHYANNVKMNHKGKKLFRI